MDVKIVDNKVVENTPEEKEKSTSVMGAYVNILRKENKLIAGFIEPLLLIVAGIYILSLGSILFYIGFCMVMVGFVLIFIYIFKSNKSSINYNTSYWNKMEDPLVEVSKNSKDEKAPKKFLTTQVKLEIMIGVIVLIVICVIYYLIKR